MYKLDYSCLVVDRVILDLDLCLHISKACLRKSTLLPLQLNPHLVRAGPQIHSYDRASSLSACTSESISDEPGSRGLDVRFAFAWPAVDFNGDDRDAELLAGRLACNA